MALQFEKPFKDALEFCPVLALVTGHNNRVAFARFTDRWLPIHVVELGDWIVREDGRFDVYSPEEFVRLFIPATALLS